MEADVFRRHTVDFSLGDGDAVKDAQRVPLYESGEFALLEERADLAVAATVVVRGRR